MTEETIHDTESTPEEREQATIQGWRDDPSHPQYKTAKKFLEDGERIAPLAARHNKRLETQLEKTQQELKELREDIFKYSVESEKRGYEKAVKELEKRKARAFEEGDIDALKEIDKEAKDLKPPEVKAAPKAAPVDPIFVQWREENSWYGVDRVMTAAADVIGEEIMQTSPKYGMDFYNEVRSRVEQELPHKFEVKQKPAAVESGGRTPKSNGKKDWSSLPEEIKKEATSQGYLDRWYKGDKEAYAKAYHKAYPNG